MTELGDGLAPGAAALAVLMIGVWALSVRLHDASIVDPVWGLPRPPRGR